jgi:hypothetical protein
MTWGHASVALAVVVAGITVAAAIAWTARYEITPFSWGYSWRDRWTNRVAICETMRPTDFDVAGRAMHWDYPQRCRNLGE